MLVGIGTAVNTEWLETSGLVLENGIVCGSDLAAVGVSNVYAVGDVCRWSTADGEETVRLEHWTNAVDQALVVAHNITSTGEPRDYQAVEYVWSDQYDWKIQVVGRTGAERYDLVGSPREGRFAVTYAADAGIITGAVIVNWPRALVACRRDVAAKGDVDEVRELLRSLAEKSTTPTSAALGV